MNHQHESSPSRRALHEMFSDDDGNDDSSTVVSLIEHNGRLFDLSNLLVSSGSGSVASSHAKPRGCDNGDVASTTTSKAPELPRKSPTGQERHSRRQQQQQQQQQRRSSHGRQLKPPPPSADGNEIEWMPPLQSAVSCARLNNNHHRSPTSTIIDHNWGIDHTRCGGGGGHDEDDDNADSFVVPVMANGNIDVSNLKPPPKTCNDDERNNNASSCNSFHIDGNDAGGTEHIDDIRVDLRGSRRGFFGAPEDPGGFGNELHDDASLEEDHNRTTTTAPDVEEEEEVYWSYPHQHRGGYGNEVHDRASREADYNWSTPTASSIEEEEEVYWSHPRQHQPCRSQRPRSPPAQQQPARPSSQSKSSSSSGSSRRRKVGVSGGISIEVSPGVFANLRGSEETWNALEAGFVADVECLCCGHQLLCIADAEFVLCPDCRVVSPVCDSLVQAGNFHNSCASLVQAYGVGLGAHRDR